MISDKIRPHHLERRAILYVRQSSAHQVLHNRESSALQYAMRDRLTTFGWSEIEVIDDDLGRSAAGGVQRAGFGRTAWRRPNYAPNRRGSRPRGRCCQNHPLFPALREPSQTRTGRFSRGGPMRGTSHAENAAGGDLAASKKGMGNGPRAPLYLRRLRGSPCGPAGTGVPHAVSYPSHRLSEPPKRANAPRAL
jgi:hypothetical protein